MNFKNWIDGELVNASILNQELRSKLQSIWVGTTAKDMDFYASADAKARIPIGNVGETLTVRSDGYPGWQKNFFFLSSPLTNSVWGGGGGSDHTYGTYTYTANAFNSALPTNCKGLMISLTATFGTVGNWVNIRPGGASSNCLVVMATGTTGTFYGSGLVPLNSNGEFEIFVQTNTKLISSLVNVWGYMI